MKRLKNTRTQLLAFLRFSVVLFLPLTPFSWSCNEFNSEHKIWTKCEKLFYLLWIQGSSLPAANGGLLQTLLKSSGRDTTFPFSLISRFFLVPTFQPAAPLSSVPVVSERCRVAVACVAPQCHVVLMLVAVKSTCTPFIQRVGLSVVISGTGHRLKLTSAKHAETKKCIKAAGGRRQDFISNKYTWQPTHTLRATHRDKVKVGRFWQLYGK